MKEIKADIREHAVDRDNYHFYTSVVLKKKWVTRVIILHHAYW